MKKRFNLANNLFMMGFIFWLLETFVFIMLYGWHTEPINPAEKICDTIVTILYIAAFVLWFDCLNKMIKSFIETLDEQ